MPELKDVLAELVPKKGKNPSQVAKKLGISSQLLGQYIAGRQIPKAPFFKKWQTVFGESLESLTETNVSVNAQSSGRPDYEKLYVQATEREIAFLHRLMETSLSSILDLQYSTYGQVMAKNALDAESRGGQKELDDLDKLSAAAIEKKKRKGKQVVDNKGMDEKIS